jgi:excinuclease ABC subunit A
VEGPDRRAEALGDRGRPRLEELARLAGSGTAPRFFDWLESKAYKMHIRVLLSRYRAYTPCTACGGARLKPDALLWRIGGADEDAERFAPKAAATGASAAGVELERRAAAGAAGAVRCTT